MILLNENQKQTLINKIKFTLTYLMSTTEDIEKVFDVRVMNSEKNEVTLFELQSKENKNTFFYIKKLYDGGIEIRYTICSNTMNFSDESTLKFNIGEKDDEDFEFVSMIEKMFKLVTEIEMRKQFEKLNSSINDLIRF